jgi:hypothetical protein
LGRSGDCQEEVHKTSLKGKGGEKGDGLFIPIRNIYRMYIFSFISLPQLNAFSETFERHQGLLELCRHSEGVSP